MLLIAVLLLSTFTSAAYGQSPCPTPTEAQRRWQQMEMNAFVHFGPNTFTGEEWGDGREDPTIFNPTTLDARQWTRAFKAAGVCQ